MIKRCAGIAAALLLIAASGAFWRSRLDAVSGASRLKLRQGRPDQMYLLGVNTRSPRMADARLRDAVRRAACGEKAAPLSGSPALRIAYDEGEPVLRERAEGLKRALRGSGFRVVLSPCSPVMLRSKALAGACDVFFAPRRVILRSDIERLGADDLPPLRGHEGRKTF